MSAIFRVNTSRCNPLLFCSTRLASFGPGQIQRIPYNFFDDERSAYDAATYFSAKRITLFSRISASGMNYFSKATRQRIPYELFSIASSF
jgi:hypothetical protein